MRRTPKLRTPTIGDRFEMAGHGVWELYRVTEQGEYILRKSGGYQTVTAQKLCMQFKPLDN